MSLRRYLVAVLAVTAVSLGLVRLVLDARLSPAQWQASLLGAGLAAANTVLAYALVQWSAHRSTRAFMAAILGGMAGRMALMLAALVAAVLVFDLPEGALVASLLSYFVVFLIMELTALPRPGERRLRA